MRWRGWLGDDRGWRAKDTTHNDTATKVLGRVEHGLRNVIAQPLCLLGEHRKESTSERANENDEDGRDSEASVRVIAAASATIELLELNVFGVGSVEETKVATHGERVRAMVGGRYRTPVIWGGGSGRRKRERTGGQNPASSESSRGMA